MVIFVLEDQSHLQIHAQCEQMEPLLMMLKLFVNPNVEMVSDIHQRNEMMAMMTQQLMDVHNLVILVMDMLAQEDQHPAQIHALSVLH